MSATYMHIGIPITNKKPGMVYNEGAKFWVSNVDDYDYKIEYLKFEEGTPFPEEIHRNPHVAYKVDDLEHYIADGHLRPHGRQRQGRPAGLRLEGRGHSGALPGGLNFPSSGRSAGLTLFRRGGILFTPA